MGLQKKKIVVPHIDRQRTVSVKLMGNISEISISDRLNRGATIRPISGEAFIVLSTGEVKEFAAHADNRAENRRNLEKTMRNLSGLINTNVTPENIECCRFITLTYRENQRDPQQLYSDFKRFNQRFKRYVKKLDLQYEYIFVLEAQARGALHAHCIYIFNSAPPFFDSSIITEIWGQGFVSIKSLTGNPDDIGKYLCSYLSDFPDDENPPLEAVGGSIKEVNVNGKQKRIIKGGRLKLISAGTRIYRCSRGIKKPVIIQTPYAEALEHLADMGFEKVYESALELRDPESDFKSTCVKQVFKRYTNPTYNRKEHH